MESGNLSENHASAEKVAAELPLQVRATGKATAARSSTRLKVVFGVAVCVLVIAGFALWSLRVPSPVKADSAVSSLAEPVGIAALGRLEPKGGVVAVAAPGPSRDAVVRELLISQGSVVEAGDVLAVMETRSGAEAAQGKATAELALRQAEVDRVRRTFEANKADNAAQIAVAQARQTGAQQALVRANRLAGGSAMTPARLEELQTDRDARTAELSQAEARRIQFAGEVDNYPDVVSAEAALEASRAALRLAEIDVENALVRAPVAGRIISVAVKVGEPSTSGGLLRLAASGPFQAILEVHQDRIALVKKGARVTLRAAAFQGELTGQVESIGIEVQRQAVFDADPAANSDARVFEVRVTLDEASSAIARDLINLQVLASIQTGGAP